MGGISFTTGAGVFSLVLATGIVVPFILPISIGLSLSSIVCFGLNKVTDVKTRKYRNLETLSQNELLEVKRIYSKALEDGKISDEEHSFILDVEDNFNEQLKNIKKKHRKEVDVILTEVRSRNGGGASVQVDNALDEIIKKRWICF